MDEFSRRVGEVLREARMMRGLTLAAVAARSSGRFKASILGGYERGEKKISLERFWTIARFYGIPPDQLLAQAIGRLGSEGSPEEVIDLSTDETGDLSLMAQDSASFSLMSAGNGGPGANMT